MSLLVVILCTAVGLLHGVNCHLFPQAILNTLRDKASPEEYKRQTNAQLQCVSDRLDAAFPGNTSRFVSDCRVAAVTEFELDTTNTAHLQAVITTVYRALCVPECGNVVHDAYNDCGVFSVPFCQVLKS